GQSQRVLVIQRGELDVDLYVVVGQVALVQAFEAGAIPGVVFFDEQCVEHLFSFVETTQVLLMTLCSEDENGAPDPAVPPCCAARTRPAPGCDCALEPRQGSERVKHRHRSARRWPSIRRASVPESAVQMHCAARPTVSDPCDPAGPQTRAPAPAA